MDSRFCVREKIDGQGCELESGRERQCRHLRLSEEEASRLADATTRFHVPPNFLILEAVQAGLQTLDPTTIPRRRRKIVYIRLPPEIKQRVKELARELGLTQQSLIRHYLSTYLTQLAADRTN